MYENQTDSKTETLFSSPDKNVSLVLVFNQMNCELLEMQTSNSAVNGNNKTRTGQIVLNQQSSLSAQMERTVYQE